MKGKSSVLFFKGKRIQCWLRLTTVNTFYASFPCNKIMKYLHSLIPYSLFWRNFINFFLKNEFPDNMSDILCPVMLSGLNMIYLLFFTFQEFLISLSFSISLSFIFQFLQRFFIYWIFLIKILPFRCYEINSLQLTDGREWVLLFPNDGKGVRGWFPSTRQFCGQNASRSERMRDEKGCETELCCAITANRRSARLDGHSQLWNQPAGIRFALTRTISRHASQPLGQRGKGEEKIESERETAESGDYLKRVIQRIS